LELELWDVSLLGKFSMNFSNLIGWGIRNITFADYGKVSPSNPVRQSLYHFEDVTAGKYKATTAAEALHRIHPTIEAKGHVMKIQMPGHQIREEDIDAEMEHVHLLDKLIKEHDAIYLLLDTREARWLPTVVAAAHNKVEYKLNLDLPECSTWL
jgi:ubiquitin-like modifier-activating enzyme ATG7